MKITVSNNCESPIYEQIKTQILQAILAYELLPGEMLPSMRGLAKDLKVGVLTVNHAYTELENEGYIENVQGKGCFVAESSSALIKQHLTEEAVKKMEQAIVKAKKAGCSEEEILTLFQQCLGDISVK